MSLDDGVETSYAQITVSTVDALVFRILVRIGEGEGDYKCFGRDIERATPS